MRFIKTGWGAVIAISVLLAGCQTGVSTDPAYAIPDAGSMVQVKRQLKIPGGQTRVFLQRGEVVSKVKLDRYYPSCNFEVWRLSQGPTIILPGTFAVTKAGRGTDLIVSLEPVRLAGLRWSHYDDDDHAMIMRVVHMLLQSAKQPNVYRLTCRGWLAVPAEAQEPGVADMREALGGLASIRVDGE